jgi:HK97 family phage portal protein
VALGDNLRNALSALLGATNPALTIEYSNSVTEVLGMDIEDLWRTQPHLRTLVTFLARNIAQLGFQFFERVSDTDRQRVHDDPVAMLFKRPNDHTTSYELFYGLVADLALYDEAFWMIYQDSSSQSGWTIEALSPAWVFRRGGQSAFSVDWIEFRRPNSAQVVRVNIADMVWFKGWNPGAPRHSSSPVEALKQILAEQISAQIYRNQVWRRGGRAGTVITRPAGATWDAPTKEKFRRQFNAKFSGNDGSEAGGTPILEDGMTLTRLGFSAKEDDYVEGTKLALALVASVFHVNPTMVGLLDNANFSNVREFRKMLYGDTLGSTIAMIEDRINTFVVPRVATTTAVYGEFNIAEKLQGSFDEQAAALSTLVGAPAMTRNEGRSKLNLPAIDGGDELVTPLNVLVGGQASPRDSGSQNRNSRHLGEMKAVRQKSDPISFKSDDLDTVPYVDKTAEVLRSFFTRQQQAVLSRLGAKANAGWWDGDRWDAELGDDLYKLAVTTATQLGRDQAERMGFQPGDYDEDRTLAFLKAVAASRAGAINSTTRDRVKAALAAGDDPGDVFEEAKSARVDSGSTAYVAALAGFALVEAGRQLVGTSATKTWQTGPNPRPEHAAMDGETVAIDDKFSNGADWPGDPVLGAEGVAGCNCGVQLTY